MTLNTEILVVSGLPRSGTSLMMSMLERGGISILADQERAADADNPRGYFELQRVKQLKEDSSWIHLAHGKAVKVVSSLLYDLPSEEQYRVLFMNRHLDEVLSSQAKMLQRRGQPEPAVEKIRNAFNIHLERLFEWIQECSYITLLPVNYNELMTDAQSVVETIADFVSQPVDTAEMYKAIDPELYRNRSPVQGS